MDETRIDDRIDASARFGDVPSNLLCAHLFNITTTGEDTTLCVDDFGSTTQHLLHDDSSPMDLPLT